MTRGVRHPRWMPSAVPNLAYPSDAYFQQIASDLTAAGIGTPQVFIDMDCLDANIAEIVSKAGASRYRIVEKSLPSLDLLSYVQQKSGSQKFLVLHLPFLPGILSTFPNADVLVGKSHLWIAIQTFFTSQPKASWPAIAKRVTFIADNMQRLTDLVTVANNLGIVLKLCPSSSMWVSGGAASPTPASSLRCLRSFSRTRQQCSLPGSSGTTDTWPSRPAARSAQCRARGTMQRPHTPQSYVDILNQQFPALVTPNLVFNSGGSATYPMYTSGPVNDVAAGGGVLRPGDYPNYVIGALQPAIFIATPVFKVYPAPELPFFTAEQSATLFKGLQGVTIYGGGWPAFFTYPAGIQGAPFTFDPTDYAMVPNQGMVTAPASAVISPGDWVFYHPRQSDALFQFEQIMQVRGGRLQTTTMAAYPRRY